MDTKFKTVLPVEFEKTESGDWRVYGLASTPKLDQQGEIVNVHGLDLAPISQGKGIFNFDHQKGPENTVGIIDTYQKDENGLYLGGYLFKNHDRAKSIYQIMSSLKKEDRGRMGMSIEGIIKKRTGNESKVIDKAVITACALTMNPVNQETYVDLAKSLGAAEQIVFDFGNLEIDESLIKALGVGAGYATTTPSNLSGGDALATEEFGDRKEKDKKKKRKLKNLTAPMAKGMIIETLDKLQDLYPNLSRQVLWELFKERLNTKFPELNLGK